MPNLLANVIPKKVRILFKQFALLKQCGISADLDNELQTSKLILAELA